MVRLRILCVRWLSFYLGNIMLLKGWHSFRIMCAANVANVVVLLVSRGVRSPPIYLKSDSARVRLHQWVFDDDLIIECVLNPFCQNSVKGVSSGLTNVLVSITQSIWWLRCKMNFNQDFGNTNIKAHVESPWPEGNGSDWIVDVSIIPCRHSLCCEIY